MIKDDDIFDTQTRVIDVRQSRTVPTSISLGPGEKIQVVSASREYGRFRDLAVKYDITKLAKQYLETTPLVGPR